MTSPGAPHPVSLRWHVLGASVAVALLLLTPTYSDGDLWGHTRFGLDFLRTWTLPSADPYSFLQGRDWINHEWLSEAVMAVAFLIGGGTGLVVLKVALVGVMTAITCHRLKGATPVFTGLVALVSIAMSATVVLTVRPHLWSLVGLVALVALVDRPAAPSMNRGLTAAALFAAWANLHGGWVTGGGVLFVWAVVRGLRRRAEAARWLALGAACLAATLINPYGAGLWRFLATTVRSTRPDITEWAPLIEAPALVWIPVVVALLATLALSVSADREARPSPEAWAVVLVLVLASLRVARIASLAGPTVLALLAPRMVRAWGHRLALAAVPRAGALVFAMPVALFLAIAAGQARDAGCIHINPSTGPDVAAGLALSGRSGRLWNTFDWGEYAIWHAGPDLQVAIDGRRETVYADDVIAWTRSAELGNAAALRRMLTLQPEYVWLPSNRVLARAALISHGYRVDVTTARSFVAVRRDQPPVTVRPSSPTGCFP